MKHLTSVLRLQAEDLNLAATDAGNVAELLVRGRPIEAQAHDMKKEAIELGALATRLQAIASKLHCESGKLLGWALSAETLRPSDSYEPPPEDGS